MIFIREDDLYESDRDTSSPKADRRQIADRLRQANEDTEHLPRSLRYPVDGIETFDAIEAWLAACARHVMRHPESLSPEELWDLLDLWIVQWWSHSGRRSDASAAASAFEHGYFEAFAELSGDDPQTVRRIHAWLRDLYADDDLEGEPPGENPAWGQLERFRTGFLDTTEEVQQLSRDFLADDWNQLVEAVTPAEVVEEVNWVHEGF